MRKILFSRESEIIQPLRKLVCEQKHITLVMWALDSSKNLLDIFERYFPSDRRPRIALEKAKEWALGEIKMPEAKRAILDAHNAATEVNDNPVAQAAARAIGHAAATVHVETHALGLVFYGLTSYYYLEGTDRVLQEVDYFYQQLIYWQNNIHNIRLNWASFLTKEKPNQEKLLNTFKKKEYNCLKQYYTLFSPIVCIGILLYKFYNRHW